MIRKLVAEYPVPEAETPRFLRIADLGEFSPFELASAFKIWQAASPAQREKVEASPGDRSPQGRSSQLGSRLKHRSRETKPADFDEEKWIGLLEEYWHSTRPVMLLDEVTKNEVDRSEEAAKKKQEAIAGQILRRQAINLYFRQDEAAGRRSGSAGAVRRGLPPWLQIARSTSIRPMRRGGG